MKKLFLTVALVGGMLSFAAMNNGEPTKPAKQTKKVVVAEENPDANYCTALAWQANDTKEGGMTYAQMDVIFLYCTCCL